jgi:hypothetical protein
MDYCRALLRNGFLSAKPLWPKFETRIKIGEIKFRSHFSVALVSSPRVGFDRSRSVAHHPQVVSSRFAPPPLHLTNTKKWSEEIFNGKRLLKNFQIGPSFETLQKKEKSH